MRSRYILLKTDRFLFTRTSRLRVPVQRTHRQAGLLTHIAATGKRFVVHADEKLTAFRELNRQLVALTLALFGHQEMVSICQLVCRSVAVENAKLSTI